VWFRPFGFKLYARIFGCNLDEMKEQDLTAYKSLGEFFYRELAPGLRPVAAAPLVSPADGTVLHFGQVTDFRVEQVKGLTYSLDALLGADPPPAPPNSPAGSGTSTPTEGTPDMDVVAHQDFANVNGIEYSLGQLLGSSGPATPADTALAPRHSHAGDVSVQDTPLPEALAHDAGVAADMGAGPALARRRSWSRRSSSRSCTSRRATTTASTARRRGSSSAAATSSASCSPSARSSRAGSRACSCSTSVSRSSAAGATASSAWSPSARRTSAASRSTLIRWAAHACIG
jgi:hypothetical protein